MKLLSANEQDYYKGSLIRLVYMLQGKDDGLYTFEIQSRAKEKDWSLAWQLCDAPKLRQALNTLTEQGLVEKIQLSWNWVKWKTTEKGSAWIKDKPKFIERV